MRYLIVILVMLALNFVNVAYANVVSVDADSIERAILTDAIENREPVNELGSTVNTNQDTIEVTFFTQVLNHKDRAITHLWFYGNELMAEVELDIGSPNWRTYSTKTILPEWQGQWRVLVVNSDQDILVEYEFNVES